MTQLSFQLDDTIAEADSPSNRQDRPALSLSQVAEVFEVTPPAVLKTERRALFKLRLALDRRMAPRKETNPCSRGSIQNNLRALILLLAILEDREGLQEPENPLDRARTKLWLALECLAEGDEGRGQLFGALRSIRDRLLTLDENAGREALHWVGSALSDLAGVQATPEDRTASTEGAYGIEPAASLPQAQAA